MAGRVRVWVDFPDTDLSSPWCVDSCGWDLYVDGEHLAGLVTRDHAGPARDLAGLVQLLLEEGAAWTPAIQPFPE